MIIMAHVIGMPNLTNEKRCFVDVQASVDTPGRWVAVVSRTTKLQDWSEWEVQVINFI